MSQIRRLTPDDVIKRNENSIRNADRRGVYRCPRCGWDDGDDYQHSMADGEDDSYFDDLPPIDWNRVFVIGAIVACFIACFVSLIVITTKI